MTLRNEPCPCGSGQRYKRCCGSLGNKPSRPPPAVPEAKPKMYGDLGVFNNTYRGEAMRQFCSDLPESPVDGLAWTPPGVLVVKDHLDQASCERWRTILARNPSTPARVQKVDEKTGALQPVFERDQQRVTEHVQPGDLKQDIRDVVMDAFKNTVMPHFGSQLHWMSPPGVLKYVSGGKYDAHSDNEYWDDANGAWVRSLDRDYSLLLYLNDDFEGGGLHFSNFDLRLKPEPGMLVAFPSDHRFQHEAEPVQAGERYVIVSWAAALGVPKINSFPNEAILP